MNLGHIIIVIIVVVIIFGLIQVVCRDKGMTKKEAFSVGALSGLGCILPLLYNIFIFFVTIVILYGIYSWIFG